MPPQLHQKLMLYKKLSEEYKMGNFQTAVVINEGCDKELIEASSAYVAFSGIEGVVTSQAAAPANVFVYSSEVKDGSATKPSGAVVDYIIDKPSFIDEYKITNILQPINSYFQTILNGIKIEGSKTTLISDSLLLSQSHSTIPTSIYATGVVGQASDVSKSHEVIISKIGNNHFVSGENGSIYLIIQNPDAVDTISNFLVGDEFDRILIIGVNGVESFEDLKFSESDDGTHINFANQELFLPDVAMNDVDEGQFKFMPDSHEFNAFQQHVDGSEVGEQLTQALDYFDVN